MSSRYTQGPWVSVQFLFWHPLLITHVNDWSPGLGIGSRDGSPCYMMALWLRPSSGQFLLPSGTVETDTYNGPRAVRLSSERPAFGPETLPISGPWGASCTGAARYLWLFVWCNPTQLKPRLTPAPLRWLWILRALATERRTPLLFVRCDLANWFWSGQSRVPGGKNTEMECDGSLLLCVQVLKWTCCYELFPLRNDAKNKIQRSQLKLLRK